MKTKVVQNDPRMTHMTHETYVTPVNHLTHMNIQILFFLVPSFCLTFRHFYLTITIVRNKKFEFEGILIIIIISILF